jgi:SHS family sialic acid transporter-like MFS transporter
MQKQAETTAHKRGIWMALIAALLGWMFDGFEIGMFPLVGPSALNELLAAELVSDPALRDQWFGVIMAVFLVGAATGGVVFGWLGDRVGRVRAMSLSIFTYAIFTGLCGFADQAWHIAVLRFIASLGMGGEWALGVALVTELWPDKSRALIAGLIGAAANVGMLLVGLLSLVLVSFIKTTGEWMRAAGMSEEFVSYLLSGDGWRLMMIAGALPALLIFFIRLFVPESHKWEAERRHGGTSFWATADLLGVVIGALGAIAVITVWSPFFKEYFSSVPGAVGDEIVISQGLQFIRIVVTILGLITALLGYIYPVVRYLSRSESAGRLHAGERGKYIRRMLLGACLAGVALLGTWGSLQWAPKWAAALARELPAESGPYLAKEYTQIASASGAVIGAVLAALVAGWLGRRITYSLLCVGSFISLIYLYQANDAYGASLLFSAFAAGGITAAFYGWFPLYLPELFPTSIRATAQGFAYNFGRVLSAIGTLHTATLTTLFAGDIAKERIEIEAFPKAGAALAGIYLVGLVIIWLAPETKGKALPE